MKKIICAFLAVLMLFDIGLKNATFAADNTKVIYISNAQQLMQIKSGGVYELTSDIDCSGKSFSTVIADNVTIYGNGYTVSDMAFYDDVAYDYGYNAFGYIVGLQNVIYDTVFKNITLEGTISTEHLSYNTVLGLARAVNCEIYGSIDVSAEGANNRICLLMGENSYIDMDVSVRSSQESHVAIKGIYQSTACSGDVRLSCFGDSVDFSGIFIAEDCDLRLDAEFNDINSESASIAINGMVNASGSSLSGEIAADVSDVELRVANGCDTCYIDTDIFLNCTDYVGAELFINSKDCYMTGSFIGELKDNENIHFYTLCDFYLYVFGSKSENCTFDGEIDLRREGFGRVSVDVFGNNKGCVHNGNISVINKKGSASVGIGGEDCIYRGNISITGKKPKEMYCTICQVGTSHLGESSLINPSVSTAVYGTLKCVIGDEILSCRAGEMISSMTGCGIDKIRPYDKDNYYICNCGAVFESCSSAGLVACTPNPEPKKQKFTYVMQVVDEVSGAPIKGAQIDANGETYITDENGAAIVKGSRLIENLTVSSEGKELYSEEIYMARGGAMNTLEISSFDIGTDDIEFANADSAQIKGPDINIGGMKLPIFDYRMDIEQNFFDTVTTAYDSEANTFKVLFGDSSEIGELKKGRYTPSFKQKFREAEKLVNAVNRNMGKPWLFKHYLKPTVNKEASLMGYIELSFDGTNVAILDGGAVLTLSAGYSGGMPLPAAPYLYYAYSISGDLSGNLKCTPTAAPEGSPPISIGGTVTGSFTPSLGAGLGWRGMMGAEAGIEGNLTGEFTFPFKSFPESFTAKLDAQYYFLFYLLGMEEKVKHTFVNFDIYPEAGNFELMNIENIEENLTSVQIPDEAPLSLQSEDEGSVKENIYPYSDVQTVALAEGKTLMVWLDSDRERAQRDQTALYYAVIENGALGEIFRINNDGTADFTFDLSSDGESGGAGIVWQNCSMPVAENASLSETAQNVDLLYAAFDGTSWSTPVSITQSNSNYEYSPSLDYYWENADIAWIQNNKNEPVPGLGGVKETVYSVRYNYEGMSEKTVVFEDMPLIYELEAAYDSVACIVDKDGDTQTNKDTVLYLNNGFTYEGRECLSALEYDAEAEYYCFSEGNVLKSVTRYDSYMVKRSEEIENGQNLRMIQGNSPIVIYEAQEGLSSELYGIYIYEDDTAAVKITDFDGRIRAWDAWFDENDNLQLVTVVATVQQSGNEVVNTARLIRTQAIKPDDDIVLEGIWTDDNVFPGGNTLFELAVENNTSKRLSELDVTLTADGCGTIYEATVSVDIAAGESAVAEIKCTLPQNFEKGSITAKASSKNVTEENSENNSVTEIFGGVNLTVNINGDRVVDSEKLTVSVINNGAEAAKGALLTVTGENGASLFEKEIGVISGGESCTYTLPVSKEYYTFDNYYEGFSVKAEITSDSTETVTYDNFDLYRIQKEKATLFRTKVKSVVLEKGEAFTPDLLTDGKLYAISDNESVATVADDGTVTAGERGTAEISYITTGALYPAKLTVYVRSSGMPEITDVSYEDECVVAVVDTTDCLLEDETQMLILALYDKNDTFLGIKTEAVTGKGEKEIYCDSAQKPTRIKVMIWNDFYGLKPVAYMAEVTVE